MSCRNDCCKIAVRVQRIYNGATLLTRGTFSSEPSNFVPSAYTPPLTYISARGNGEAVITSLSVSSVDGSGRSRVRLAFSYDVSITYEDAAGVRGTAAARINDEADILITLPDDPYTLSASVEFASVIGTLPLPQAEMTACRRLNVRVLIPCDVLICTAGCAPLPGAELTEDSVCRELV